MEYLMRQKNEDSGLPPTPQYEFKIYPVGSTSPHTSLSYNKGYQQDTLSHGVHPWEHHGLALHPRRACCCRLLMQPSLFLIYGRKLTPTCKKGRGLPIAHCAGPGLRQQWAQNPTWGTKVRVLRPAFPDFHLVKNSARNKYLS